MKRTALITAVAVLNGAGAVGQATLEEVLQCHYETIGGLDAWQDLETVRAEGVMVFGGAVEAPFTMYSKRPRMQRIETIVQGVTSIQAFDGETGWTLVRFGDREGVERLSDEQVRAMREDSDLDGPLIGYREEGNTLELLGTSEVEGIPAYELLVTLPGGQERTYYLETENCLAVQIEAVQEQAGDLVEVETVLGDYREVDGLVMAHFIGYRIRGLPGESRTVIIEELELNVPLPDTLFDVPEGEW